jgi:hypothetical protein
MGAVYELLLKYLTKGLKDIQNIQKCSLKFISKVVCNFFAAKCAIMQNTPTVSHVCESKTQHCGCHIYAMSTSSLFPQNLHIANLDFLRFMALLQL